MKKTSSLVWPAGAVVVLVAALGLGFGIRKSGAAGCARAVWELVPSAGNLGTGGHLL